MVASEQRKVESSMPFKSTERQREWQKEYAKRPHVKARQSEYQKKKMQNPEERAKQAERIRIWAQNNKEKRREQSLRWRVNNRERYLELIRARYAEKAALIASLKTGPCVDCGGRFHHAAMDFDHVNGDKKFCIASRKTASIDDILEEVVKCELVCSNCHRIRTWKRKQRSPA